MHYYRQPPTHLSPTQKHVLQLIANGFLTKQIAIKLGISHRTVESHRQDTLVRLGASTSAQAVAIAIRSGIIK